MKVKALKTVLHDELGRIEAGTEFDATEAQLGGIEQFVEVYKTKVIQEVPDVADNSRNKVSPKTRPKQLQRGRKAT